MSPERRGRRPHLLHYQVVSGPDLDEEPQSLGVEGLNSAV